MTYSLIVCTRKSHISNKLKDNIKETISAKYELVIIDNSQKKLSIFEAYNLGIDRSSGDYLIFLHDDILFQTKGWGEIIKKTFNDHRDLGLLGIAGSTIKTKMPSTWWAGPGLNYIRIMQHDQANSKMFDKEEGFNGEFFAEVAVIDGVFMVMKKDQRIRFDESLKGYHNYDLSLSLTHNSIDKKVGVTGEILIEHASGGKINKDWYISASKFHKNNYDKLPIIKSKVSAVKLKNIEFTNGAKFVMGLLDNNLNKEAFYWWVELLKIKLIAKFHFKVITRLLKNVV